MSVPTHRGPALSPVVDVLQTWGVTLVLLPICAYCLVSYVEGVYTYLDAGSLIIHEAGHLVFAPFGRVMHLLGGTLMQFLIPLAVIATFVRTSYAPGIQVGTAWLGQNALNVSTYAADAQERALPLITRDASTHDWGQLLTMADLLAYDDVFGHLFLALGLLAFGTALLVPRFVW